jgi:hypothetical protein
MDFHECVERRFFRQHGSCGQLSKIARRPCMNFSYEDIEAYAVGLGISLAIYGVMFMLLPYLFSKFFPTITPKIAGVATGAATAVQNAIKPKYIFPFQTFEVKGDQAMAAFEAAKIDGKGVPVIIGGNESMVQGLADMMSYLKPKANDYIRKAEANPNPYPTKSGPKLPKTWPRVGPFDKERNPFSIHLHPEGFKPAVTIAFIPAQSSAEIPAYLKLGSWNAVPDADIFVALLRKWQRDYGAELVALTMDVIDVRVARKPATHQEAMVLAREHAKFCSSTEVTIAERAAELMQLDWWHFWWD